MKADNLEDIYQLSPMQQGLLFHTLLAPEAGVYTVQVTCRLCGDLDSVAFERTWQQVIDRHSILRTCFLWEDLETPVQVVQRQVPIAIAYQDWRGLPSAEQDRRLEAYLETNQRRAFTLSEAPLMQLELFQLADDQHQFVWSHHHLLLDGWSEFLVFQEVFQLYDTFSRGQTIHLEAARPYGDYIEWLQRQDLSRAEEFWRIALKGFTAPTPFRVDRAIGAAAGHAPNAEQRCNLSTATTAALQALARQHQLTLNTLVQGAWALLLNRYSGEADVVFGATVAGRPPGMAGIESMIGLFINTLPIRVSIDGRERLLPWLKQLQAKQAEVRQFEYSPLAQVQKWSDAPRGTPLFESIIIFENYPVDAALQALPGRLNVRDTRFVARTNYPMTLVVVPGRELLLKLSYDSSRFDADTIARMLGHLQVALEGFLLDLEQPLGALPLLSAAERQKLLVEWNATATPYLDDRCIHQLFEAQATHTPDAIAIVCGEQQLTYRELDARANQLAHYLQQYGVGPETRVAVCVERSIELVVGLLGVLKAGGAYVPLDPTYPPQRLEFMLEDSLTPLLLTQERLQSELSFSGFFVIVVALDLDWELIAAEPAVCPTGAAHADHPAYVIYTSGSTGSPKGVQVAHRGLGNMVQSQIASFGVRPDSRVLQFASASFDASVSEIFMALVAGATLVIEAPNDELPGLALLELIDRLAITTVTLPPSALAAMPVKELPTLETLIVAGEACSADLLARWAPGRRVFDAYGPTEATVCATLGPWNAGSQPPSIGRPIANTQVYLLDSQMRPVPLGVPGEIYIGGIGLARGYLNRPDLTAERFVPNPFTENKEQRTKNQEPRTKNQELLSSALGGLWSVVGGRLYRTGDLARYLPDGAIEFLGRLDHQVKVRGFRIELAEIEATLNRHPAVRECLVMAREDLPGHKRLVAYIVSSQLSVVSGKSQLTTDNGQLTSEVRAFLKQSLPEYMVPSAFVTLDAMPLTPNGKLDRRALPPPDTERPKLAQEFVAPQNDVMRVLAEIWASVLALKQVGIHDNFFELGGDSILSVQIVARANQAGLHLTSKLIFDHPTIGALASHTTHVGAPAAPQDLLTGPLPFTPIQHWFFAQDHAAPHYWNQTLLLELRQAFDPDHLAQAWQLLIQHHDALRLRFQPTAQGWQQQYAALDPTPPFTRIDLRALPDAEQAAAVTAHAISIQQSLHLGDGPLVRVALFERGGAGRDRLLLVAHHLLIDAVSWRILLEDLHMLYSQLAEGLAPRLPPKTTSYRQWAEQLQDYAPTDRCQAELPYWRAVAAQAQPLPRDMAVGAEANTIATTRTVRVSFSAEETRALLQELPRSYQVQIGDVLLTALGQAFRDWSGHAGVLVDVEGHGREELFAEVDLSRTVGWFTTIYPLWLQVAGADLGAQVKGVKEQLRGLPGRGLGYGVLRYLHPDEQVRVELAGCAQAEVGFNYLGQLDQAVGAERGFGVAPEGVGPPASPANRRAHMLEVNGMVLGGQLVIDWSYSAALHHPESIAALAERYGSAVRALIAYCLAAEAQGYTPSDFPAMDFSQQELDEIMAELEQPL